MINPEKSQRRRHSWWVKSSHWLVTFSFVLLAISGIEMIMVHPRFYWGKVGNNLTPALFEIPLGPNYKHVQFSEPKPFFNHPGSIVSATRTQDIFNQNGWGRSLHFLAAWLLIIGGLVYLVLGVTSGHFRRRILPAARQLKPSNLWNDVKAHVKKYVQAYQEYGPLQKLAYSVVIFGLLPLAVVTGFTMSPNITSAYPFLLSIFLGGQSARTIHLFASLALEIFLLIHLVMVIRTGFLKQLKGMING